MFIPLPMRLIDPPAREPVPIANGILIALNLLAYPLLDAGQWSVGPGTSPVTILTYGFVHSGLMHLAFNMWFLWVFGNAVNRRIGSGYYVLTWLSSIVVIGLVARLVLPGRMLGSSGGVFAVMGVAMLLLPAVRVDVHWLAVFPLTLFMGVVSRPRYPVFWVLRWGTAEIRMLLLIGLFVILELCGFLWWGLNWTSLGQLFGFVCGVGCVLLMPRYITIPGCSTSF